MRHDPEIQRALAAFQLGLPRSPSSGRTGELLGRGGGSSLEFQEYRQYTPGDDIRHLDWAAYARSDILMVRMFREEISPRTEILLDCSRSMATHGQAKQRVARQLAALFSLMAGQLGARALLWPIDDSPLLRSLSIDDLEVLEKIPFSGAAALTEILSQRRVPLRKQSVRIVISDFLFPHDPAALIRQLASDASTLWMIQVLAEWEESPPVGGGRRLIDAESEMEVDLLLDQQTVDGYRQRLEFLRDELMRGCRRSHAGFVTLVAERGLVTLCRGELCAAQMLRPA